MSALTLADAKTHLNISATDTDDDVELQGFIDAAEAAVGKKCGALAATSMTARVAGGTGTLVLPTAPVVSLTSVTPVNGTAITLDNLYLDPAAGTVEYVSGIAFPQRRYDVVFEAGRTAVPPDLMLAVKELVRHLWLTQRGAAPGSPGALPNVGEFEVISDPSVSRSFSFPWRVEQLLAAYLLVDL